jgi:4a-hydroxytetrahydrobiopterin dehydratase
MNELARKKCIPCSGGTPPLPPERVEELARAVPDWTVVDGHHLRRAYDLADFAAALELVNDIGALAEEEGHHPDLQLGYGRVVVEIWTHKIDGLTESDFILAAKIDELSRGDG